MKKISFILLFGLLTATTFAQAPKHINLKDKVAIQGYDPVAYFVSSSAIEGKKEFSSQYNEAVYFFSSESNKALFVKNPSQYEPQYGGYCAYGMSFDHDAPIDPKAFAIIDAKLYLNYSSEVNEMWLKELATRLELANINWVKRNKS